MLNELNDFLADGTNIDKHRAAEYAKILYDENIPTPTRLINKIQFDFTALDHFQIDEDHKVSIKRKCEGSPIAADMVG